MPRVTLNRREVSDLEMIATGAMSPLEGFMARDDYMCVLESQRLAKGLPWTIPVTLAVKDTSDNTYNEGSDVALFDEEENFLAVLHLEDVYKVDKEYEALAVLKTTDDAHPSVAYLKSISDTYLGGPITLVNRPNHEKFNDFRLDPKETRVLFKAKGWQRIAAFQTRNPIHRAHEYLHKCALETVDALLIHPLMGETRKEDVPPEIRMKCYFTLLENYYPPDRVVLSIFPATMRYAGPREAIFHALIRKNYGCTHFIVGRDHAGVNSYYCTYAAHHIFDEFDRDEIGITPMLYDNAFFCRKCDAMASAKTCPHDAETHLYLSGTKLREMLENGDVPPPEVTRPEVAEILLESMSAAKMKGNR